MTQRNFVTASRSNSVSRNPVWLMLQATLVFAILFFLAPAAWSATYYVANNGNDAASGTTLTTPFKTIQKAMNTAVAKVPEGVTEGFYAAAGWSDYEARMDNPEVKEWAENYQAKAGEPAGTAAQLGYGAATTLIKALEAAGPELTAESFKTAMEGLQFTDPIGDVEVKYGPEDHQGADLIVISKIEGGMWKEVARVDPAQSQ